MTYILLSVLIASSVAGELMITHGMKSAGEIDDFRPGPFLRSLGRAIIGGWMPAGIAMMTISFISLLAVLSVEDVSLVVPATAITYLLNMFGAKLFLKEHVSASRWLGAALVAAGVALVSL